MEQMKVRAGITEELKATDQMKWVGLINNVKSAVEEIVAKEIIYVCGAVCSAFIEMWMNFSGWYGIIFLLLKVANLNLQR